MSESEKPNDGYSIKRTVNNGNFVVMWVAVNGNEHACVSGKVLEKTINVLKVSRSESLPVELLQIHYLLAVAAQQIEMWRETK
jgi:hypothetical protein